MGRTYTALICAFSIPMISRAKCAKWLWKLKEVQRQQSHGKVIDDMAVSPRMAVVNMWSQKEDFSDTDKTSLIDMPMSVFDDLMDAIMQDMNDETIGEPLSREKGYAYQNYSHRIWSDTDYKVKPMRKNKTAVPAKFWDNQPSLEQFVNQTDPTN